MKINQLSPNQFLVVSDSGALYKIALSGEDKSAIVCGCKGFMFRRECKHIDAVKELLSKQGKKVRVKIVKDRYDYIKPYKESMRKYLEALE